jgi:hypothetical protein
MFGAIKARAGWHWAGRGASLAACTLCCTEPAEVPAVPDLTSLADEFETPTGTVDNGAAVQDLIGRYPELTRLANAFRFTKSLVARADEGRSAADERDGRGVELRGAIDVTVACPGSGFEGAEPGSLAVSLAVSRNEIQRSFWGRAAYCRFQSVVGGVELPFVLDGDIAMDVGSNIPLTGPWPTSPMLVSLLGTLELSDLQVSGVSARVGDDAFEYLQTIETGSVVLFVTSGNIGLRDADATWTCGTDSTTCLVE